MCDSDSVHYCGVLKKRKTWLVCFSVSELLLTIFCSYFYFQEKFWFVLLLSTCHTKHCFIMCFSEALQNDIQTAMQPMPVNRMVGSDFTNLLVPVFSCGFWTKWNFACESSKSRMTVLIVRCTRNCLPKKLHHEHPLEQEAQDGNFGMWVDCVIIHVFVLASITVLACV